jgi:hypothetical protein
MPHTLAILVPYPPAVMELCERILRRAGYKPDDGVTPTGGKYQDEFDGLLRTLSYIGARKTDDYGDFRMQDIRSWEREVWGSYWDIQRKFGRLETQIDVDMPRANDIDDIMETLADQAVYCVRMIQILRRLEEKGMAPK